MMIGIYGMPTDLALGNTMHVFPNIKFQNMIGIQEKLNVRLQDLAQLSHQLCLQMENGWFTELDLKIRQH